MAHLKDGAAHDAISHHEGEQTDVRKEEGDDTARHLLVNICIKNDWLSQFK